MITNINDYKNYTKYKTFEQIFNCKSDPKYINELAKNFYDNITYDTGIDEYIDSLPLEDVDINEICPTQQNITQHKLLAKIKLDPNPKTYPMLIKTDKYYIFDGHHRVAMHKLQNFNTVKCRVLHI